MPVSRRPVVRIPQGTIRLCRKRDRPLSRGVRENDHLFGMIDTTIRALVAK
jgi:hypothetical protein